VYRIATQRIAIATVLLGGLTPILIAQAIAPVSANEAIRDWRRVGNAAIDRSLAGLATGPVNRVWYSSSGPLLIRTASGVVFATADFEAWRPVQAIVPSEPQSAPVSHVPEDGARVRTPVGEPAIAYAFGKFVYRSEDGGANWNNLTAFKNSSIIGDDIRDLAVSPANPDEIVAAGASGVFRSLDGGKTWSGINQALPNLPAMRLLTLPSGDRGVRLATAYLNSAGVPLWSAIEWAPGEKTAWRDAEDSADLAAEIQQRRQLSQRFGTQVSVVAVSGDTIYLGTQEGRLMVSNDGGATWPSASVFPLNEAGAVERFWIDPADPRVAVAVLGSRQRDPLSQVAPVHVIHTQNGGLNWDPLTGNLPDTGVHGIAVDRATGALYAATDRGVFMTYTDLAVLGANPQWTPIVGLPSPAVADVKLDPQGNQLWAAIYGLGVYSTLAPHRARDPKVVSTADLIARAAAPGSLISILGARVQTARAGDLNLPVLDANDHESQLQVPFEASGGSLSLAVQGANGPVTLPPMQLEAAAPGIFVNRDDGSPILLDAESGVMLDAMNPAHSHGRIQILATGLGRVNPDWPTGLAGPVENAPQVVAPVKAYLDRQPVEVSRAVLAPYIGFYMVEIETPKIVNYGPAELYLEVGGKASNRVRVYIEP
jgi:uncharacterized protein (TIGR03437 family)